jgi:hypothetical protein
MPARAVALSQVLLVGERSFNTFGSHGAAEHVAFRHFPTLAQARAQRQRTHAAVVHAHPAR